jgi:hypothetical protein
MRRFGRWGWWGVSRTCHTTWLLLLLMLRRRSRLGGCGRGWAPLRRVLKLGPHAGELHFVDSCYRFPLHALTTSASSSLLSVRLLLFPFCLGFFLNLSLLVHPLHQGKVRISVYLHRDLPIFSVRIHNVQIGWWVAGLMPVDDRDWQPHV